MDVRGQSGDYDLALILEDILASYEVVEMAEYRVPPLALVLLLCVVAGCSSSGASISPGTGTGTLAATAASPTALATPSPSAPSSPLPTSSATASPAAVPASHQISTGGFVLKITKVWTSRGGNWTPGDMTAAQTVLEIDVTVISATKGDIENHLLGALLSDETGHRYRAGAGGANQAGTTGSVEYVVPKASRVFVIWFSTGEAYDIAPLLTSCTSRC